MKRVSIIALLAGFLTAVFAAPPADNCAICGAKLERVVYFLVDKVTNEKKVVCERCARITTTCYLCGMPVKENFRTLEDGRILCERDVKNVVLDEAEAQKIWHDVKDALDRQFSRFV